MYILLRFLPYEGYIVSAFSNEAIAKRLYDETKKVTSNDDNAHFNAVALLKGEVLLSHNIGGDLTPQDEQLKQRQEHIKSKYEGG